VKRAPMQNLLSIDICQQCEKRYDKKDKCKSRMPNAPDNLESGTAALTF